MRLTRLLFLFIIAVLFNGCAVFKVGDLPQAALSPAAKGEPKPTVSYSLSATTEMFSKQELHPKMQEKMCKQLGETLCKSGYFSQVSSYNKSADVRMSVQSAESGNPAAMVAAFITGYSFFIIPSWSTCNYEMTVSVKTGDVQKAYRVEDSARMFMWLPMALVFPFHNFSTISEMQENMYNTVLCRMKKDGLLVKSETVVSKGIQENVVASSSE